MVGPPNNEKNKFLAPPLSMEQGLRRRPWMFGEMELVSGDVLLRENGGGRAGELQWKEENRFGGLMVVRLDSEGELSVDV